jgi:hypothetical protein
MLPLHRRHQVPDDSARLFRVVGSVGDDRPATGARQPERMRQMFDIGGVERFASDVPIGSRMHFRVEIAQPHIDAKWRQTAT